MTKNVIIRCASYMCTVVPHPNGDRFVMFVQDLKKPIDLNVGDMATLEMQELVEGSDSYVTETADRIVAVTKVSQNSLKQVIIEGTVVTHSYDANDIDPAYLDVARRIQSAGSYSQNRTATDTIKLFGTQLKIDLRKGLPLLTSKKVNYGALIKEMLWFFRGETNIKTLGSKIWDQWATEDGELGPVYGAQWRYWQAFNLVNPDDVNAEKKLKFLLDKGYTEIATTHDQQKVMFKKIDQLADMVNSLQNNPNDRRMLVTAWNPANMPDSKLSPEENASVGMQALPPCHTIWHVGTTPLTYLERMDLYIKTMEYPTDENIEEVMSAGEEENTVILDDEKIPAYYLDLLLYQRSADWFIGVPFNIASYSMIQYLLADKVNMVARDFIPTFGDYHIYQNHIEQFEEQYKQEIHTLPQFKILNKRDNLADYQPSDMAIYNYQHGPAIQADVAK